MNPTWLVLALCCDFPDLPWTADPEDRSAAAELAMTAVCGGCPVYELCATYADEQDVCSGFWAGRGREPITSDEGGEAA